MGVKPENAQTELQTQIATGREKELIGSEFRNNFVHVMDGHNADNNSLWTDAEIKEHVAVSSISGAFL